MPDRAKYPLNGSDQLHRIYIGLDSLCIHNPATGREQLIPHVANPAAVRKRIVVVGTGPAGLEAARVCAERTIPNDDVYAELKAVPSTAVRSTSTPSSVSRRSDC